MALRSLKTSYVLYESGTHSIDLSQPSPFLINWLFKIGNKSTFSNSFLIKGKWLFKFPMTTVDPLFHPSLYTPSGQSTIVLWIYWSAHFYKGEYLLSTILIPRLFTCLLGKSSLIPFYSPHSACTSTSWSSSQENWMLYWVLFHSDGIIHSIISFVCHQSGSSLMLRHFTLN